MACSPRVTSYGAPRSSSGASAMAATPPNRCTATSPRRPRPLARPRRIERRPRMTSHPKTPGERFTEDFRANAAHLEANGLYDPAEEHDACGVGFVAAIDGK